VKTRLLTTAEAAEHLTLSCKQLERWRTDGGGPAFVQLSAKIIRYRLCDLESFIKSNIMQGGQR